MRVVDTITECTLSEILHDIPINDVSIANQSWVRESGFDKGEKLLSVFQNLDPPSREKPGKL